MGTKVRLRYNMKKLWLLIIPAVFSALALINACTPDILIYEQTGTSSPAPSSPLPYDESYGHKNAGIYGTWYHMGQGTNRISPEISMAGDPSAIIGPPLLARAYSAKWRLNLYTDSSWRLAWFAYVGIDNENPGAGYSNREPEQSVFAPNAAGILEGGEGDTGEVYVPGGYGETDGYTGYVFFAAGPYFEFNGTDEITFTVSSSMARLSIEPAEKLRVKIAAVTTDPVINKYSFVPTEETAIRIPNVTRLDVVLEGEWERR